jgi:NadR type nicotinamide-nucleotide adenylyltransferase
VIRVCFHGAESTGKSVMAAHLEARFGWPWVREYGRDYAENHGTDFTMDDLLAIAQGQNAAQNAAMQAANKANPPVLILDTDPLMTAAWAQMLFGHAPDALFAYPKADLYLLFAPDVPWVADGTRFFGTPSSRAAFAATSQAMLEKAGLPYVTIGGDWAERESQVLSAILSQLQHQ